MNVIPSPKSRSATRRAVMRPCLAVATDGYRLLSQRILDLSPRGMLVWGSPVTAGSASEGISKGASMAASAGMSTALDLKLGDEVFVTFKAPGDGLWMNVETEVTRIIRGARRSDCGPCIGLRFKDLNGSARSDLLARLQGIPPTIPQRPLRWRPGPCARLRASVRHVGSPPISTFWAARPIERHQQLILPAENVFAPWQGLGRSTRTRNPRRASAHQVQLCAPSPPGTTPPECAPRGVWLPC